MINFLLLLLAAGNVFWSHELFWVEGNSMWPNILGQEFIVMRKRFEYQEIARGDVIVFENENGEYLVKRVVGLPKEKLKLRGEDVFLRDESGKFQVLQEDYLGGKKFDYGDERYFVIPYDAYFVLGDNRPESRDSRYFANPYVNREKIVGLAHLGVKK
jgi:signal peptidase I